MPGPAALRAVAQGPTTPGFTSNPFNPDGLLDELGRAWSPWDRALVGAPVGPDAFHLGNYIKNMFLDRQVTVAILSNVTPGTIQLPGEATPRPPKIISDSLDGAILTAVQPVVVGDFVQRIDGSPRLLRLALPISGVVIGDLIHLLLVQPTAVLLRRVSARNPLGSAAQRRPGHRLDDGVRATGGLVPQRRWRDRNHVCLDCDQLPHGVRPYPRSAPQVPRTGPNRIRVGLDLVWLAAVADRGALALSDSRRHAEALGLSRAHRGRQAQDSRPQLRAPVRPVWREGRGVSRRLPPGAEDLRVTHPCLTQDLDGVSRVCRGQHLEDAHGVPGDGRGPESHALRLGAESVADTDRVTVATSETGGSDDAPQQARSRRVPDQPDEGDARLVLLGARRPRDLRESAPVVRDLRRRASPGRVPGFRATRAPRYRDRASRQGDGAPRPPSRRVHLSVHG